MIGLWVKQDKASGNCSFIAQTAFEAAASEEYGAAAGWTTVDVGGAADEMVCTDTHTHTHTQCMRAMHRGACFPCACARWSKSGCSTNPLRGSRSVSRAKSDGLFHSFPSALFSLISIRPLCPPNRF